MGNRPTRLDHIYVGDRVFQYAITTVDHSEKAVDDRPTRLEHIINDIHVGGLVFRYVGTTFDYSEGDMMTARFEYYKYGMIRERYNWYCRGKEVSPPDTLASNELAMIEAFTGQPWYLYAWGTYGVNAARERDIVSNIYRICDWGLITTLRGVCKSWSKKFKTNLDAVQGSIKMVDADVVACYFKMMLLRTDSKDRLHPKLNVRYYV